MQAQTEKMEKGEFLGDYRSKIVTTTLKEISPSGIRMEQNDQGEITGKYNGRHLGTVTLLSKPDGTVEWESKAMQTTEEGDTLVYWGSGTGRSKANPATWTGELTCMTQSPRLAWLNNAKVHIEGTTDQATGEIRGKAYTK